MKIQAAVVLTDLESHLSSWAAVVDSEDRTEIWGMGLMAVPPRQKDSGLKGNRAVGKSMIVTRGPCRLSPSQLFTPAAAREEGCHPSRVSAVGPDAVTRILPGRGFALVCLGLL